MENQKNELEKIADALWFQYVICEGKDSITNPVELIKIIKDVCKAQKDASVRGYYKFKENAEKEALARGYREELYLQSYKGIEQGEITLKNF